jgi:hypothetical protein
MNSFVAVRTYLYYSFQLQEKNIDLQWNMTQHIYINVKKFPKQVSAAAYAHGNWNHKSFSSKMIGLWSFKNLRNRKCEVLLGLIYKVFSC